MLERMKIKPKAEFAFGERVNPSTTFLMKTAIRLRRPMPADVSAGTAVRVQAGKDFKDTNEFRWT
jgi:hypothetical protein